ncbi:SusD/RagB family nutrient-binding outer membrane lipoprotein [Niastella caeni]|nr:SusD/RagB family nutrient-binding outer membrane lipoprotein [Niastella caeni]
MKKILTILLCTSFIIISCTKVYEGENVDPNKPTEASPETLLKGIELANIMVQVGHIQRITGMWTGHYKGVTLLYKNLAEYNLSADESNLHWQTVYQGVVKQAHLLRQGLPGNKTFSGITKILEAHALGSTTALYGNIPFSQAADESYPDPVFDNQADVYTGIQKLLDEAIAELTSVPSSATISEDLFFAGKSTSWIAVANTLKARYYLEAKDYTKAYASALLGINALNLSLKYYPPGVVTTTDANLIYEFINVRGGYLSTNGAFLQDVLLKAGTLNTRNNAKTNEDARSKYFKITGTSATAELGVANKTAPMPMVTYEENLLILAEAGVRTLGFAEGLAQLNKVRALLRTNLGLAAMPATGGTILYNDYVATDFDPGGICNADNITPLRALLREIVEERYVTLNGTIVPFNDARRLRKTENDINVPVPFNISTATQYPERLIYAQNEINANPNVPAPLPGIYIKTPVNQ